MAEVVMARVLRRTERNFIVKLDKNKFIKRRGFCQGLLKQAFSVDCERDEAALLIPLAHCQFQIPLSIYHSLNLRKNILALLYPSLVAKKSHPKLFTIETLHTEDRIYWEEFSPRYRRRKTSSSEMFRYGFLCTASYYGT